MRRLQPILVLALFAAACGSTGAHSDATVPAEPPAPPAPWTESFLRPTVLLADRVRIEGPPGLLEHVALTQEPEHHAFRVETTSEGLVQEAVRRSPGVDVPIRCQLDRLQIAAQVRISVLERPGPVPVRVIAEGNVYWADPESGEERRGQTLELVGEPAP